jgi:hypothetical protein
MKKIINNIAALTIFTIIEFGFGIALVISLAIIYVSKNVVYAALLGLMSSMILVLSATIKTVLDEINEKKA